MESTKRRCFKKLHLMRGLTAQTLGSRSTRSAFAPIGNVAVNQQSGDYAQRDNAEQVEKKNSGVHFCYFFLLIKIVKIAKHTKARLLQ